MCNKREIQVRSAQVNTGNTRKTLTGKDREIQVITEIQARSAQVNTGNTREIQGKTEKFR